MINLVIGDRGSGKTCFITCMGELFSKEKSSQKSI
jgi:GTPase SAR1 family protein